MFISMAITFLILAIIAGVLGFILKAGITVWIAKACFYTFLVVLLIALVMTEKPA